MDRTRLLPFTAHPDQQQRAWDAPRAATLVDLLATARLTPDLVALRFVEHGESPDDLTWRRLAELADRRAAQLADLGIKPGDRVVLMLPTGPSFFDAFFGTLLARAVPVPVAPPHAARRDKATVHFENACRIADDCSAAAVVAVDRQLESFAEHLAERGTTLTLVPASPAPPGRPPCGTAAVAGDLALLQYTSGSTTHPKGVELTHANILANAAAIAGAIVHQESTGVFWLPLHHDMGLIGGALTALFCRRPAVLMPPQAFAKNPARWLQYLSDVRATITAAPNFAFGYCTRTVADDDLDGVDLSSLEVLLNGAEPVDPATITGFEARFAAWGLRPGTVRPVYGLAESALAVTFAEPGPPYVDTVDADRLERDGLAQPARAGAGRTRSFVSVGAPLPTQEIRIVDATDGVRPDRAIGHIVVRGPSVTKGYFRQPDATANALRGGWLHTGDLGYVAEGRLFVTGRSKDLIIRLGRNYHAQDFERVIAEVPGVVAGGVAVFGIESAEVTRIVVIAETRLREPSAVAELVAAIRAQCQMHFEIGPDDVRLMPPGGIPRTTSGKVRRQECRQQYEHGLAPGRES